MKANYLNSDRRPMSLMNVTFKITSLIIEAVLVELIWNRRYTEIPELELCELLLSNGLDKDEECAIKRSIDMIMRELSKIYELFKY